MVCMYVCTYVRTYVRVPYVTTASLLAGFGFALAMNWGQTGRSCHDFSCRTFFGTPFVGMINHVELWPPSGSNPAVAMSSAEPLNRQKRTSWHHGCDYRFTYRCRDRMRDTCLHSYRVEGRGLIQRCRASSLEAVVCVSWAKKSKMCLGNGAAKRQQLGEGRASPMASESLTARFVCLC